MIIGIVHHKSTAQYLPALLKSLRGARYRVVIVYNDFEPGSEQLVNRPGIEWIPNPSGGYELGALSLLAALFHTEEDFFLLHDTTVIKDQTIFDVAAQFPGSLAVCPGFGSFMGKYRRSILKQIGIPVPKTRVAAIYYEYFWNIMYMDCEPKMAMCDDPLVDTKKFVMKFGQKRMLLENVYMKKWKSNWGGFKVKIPI